MLASCGVLLFGHVWLGCTTEPCAIWPRIQLRISHGTLFSHFVNCSATHPKQHPACMVARTNAACAPHPTGMPRRTRRGILGACRANLVCISFASAVHPFAFATCIGRCTPAACVQRTTPAFRCAHYWGWRVTPHVAPRLQSASMQAASNWQHRCRHTAALQRHTRSVNASHSARHIGRAWQAFGSHPSSILQRATAWALRGHCVGIECAPCATHQPHSWSMLFAFTHAPCPHLLSHLGVWHLQHRSSHSAPHRSVIRPRIVPQIFATLN